ncbi:hypothetical protein [Formosa sp. S-31]|uniref:hypothetical protein n=1 Tax=Formosa sp. S-31 TaxID=2790949 RepID=UPI003EBF480B
MNTTFKEEQKFTQWWIWLILIPVGFIPIKGIYQQLILGEQFGDQPMSDTGLIIFSLFIFSLIALFAVMKLTTTIDKHGIRMHFFPFIKKYVNWNEVKTAKLVNYGFVGGWGIRMASKYGIVYNIKGNKGLALELKGGENFLIGTQKENELKKVLEHIAINTKSDTL